MVANQVPFVVPAEYRDRPVRITFADLTHTGQLVAANTFPLGVSLVASHARHRFGDALDLEVFKYPADLADALARRMPQVACFSNFAWNVRLATAFSRRIKEVSPTTVVIWGGVNYPLTPAEQQAFLEAHPEVDFYVMKEGERAFCGLLERLFEHHFAAGALRAARTVMGSVHYLDPDGGLVRGELLPRMTDLTETPSPYLTGLLEKFFDRTLLPMLETNRGCPFACTFCTEGDKYHSKVRWASVERTRAELTYIAERARTPDFIITDSNFGMYPQDLETARSIAELQRTRGWPKFVLNSSGKNQKERVMEVARTVGGAMVLTVSIQSADEKVLANIKRGNISLEQILEVGRGAEAMGANSYCEIILGLPGDSLSAHFDSVRQMVDGGVNEVLVYQMIMLPGTEAESPESRERFGLTTRFRVLPRCSGDYPLLGATAQVAEIEEIVVAGSTLPFADYLRCRELSFSLEIFHNSGIFQELHKLLARQGVSASRFLFAAHAEASGPDSELRDLYDGYMRENQEKLWERRADLEAFVAQPGVIERITRGELFANELYKYKVLAFFARQPQLHELAFSVARKLLAEAGAHGPEIEQYLTELRRFCLLRKGEVNDLDRDATERFHFDFVALERDRFEGDPAAYRVPGGRALRVFHSDDQKRMIHQYRDQYGTSNTGLGLMLIRAHVKNLYRRADYAG